MHYRSIRNIFSNSTTKRYSKRHEKEVNSLLSSSYASRFVLNMTYNNLNRLHLSLLIACLLRGSCLSFLQCALRKGVPSWNLSQKENDGLISLRTGRSEFQMVPRNSLLQMTTESSNDDIVTLKKGNGRTAVVAGATGYIGKAVVREAVRQGFNTVALVRDADKVQSKEGQLMYGQSFKGASVVQCDVCKPEELKEAMKKIKSETGNVDAIVSCLASRSGIKKDAYAIDYQATLNCLRAGQDPDIGARHFVLLSAFCVKNPWLQFQQAKLKFEAELTAQNDLTYSIVRPTAFFKSVSGQLEVIQQGAPFVMFGDGEVTRCNPISEADLATYLIDCIDDKTRNNKIINLGGPDEPLTMLKQGEMLFEAVGKEPNFFFAPLWLFDTIIDSLQWVADTFNSEKFENAAELGRIGKYYAVEDMLTTDPSEKFGTMTLMEHYEKIAKEGQEYDPYTTMFASKPKETSKKESVEV